VIARALLRAHQLRSVERWSDLDAERAKYAREGWEIEEGANLLLDDDQPITRGNHSCDSDLWMRDAFTLEARRDIAVGEELTVDYALQTAVDGRWLQLRVTAMSRRHVSPFLNKRIEREQSQSG